MSRTASSWVLSFHTPLLCALFWCRELFRNNQVVLFIGYTFPRGRIGPHGSPFSKTNVPSEVTLLVYLDRARPLPEPKWVKSGDV